MACIRVEVTRVTAVLIAATMVLSIGCGGDGEGDSIVVLAAASMTNVLVEVGQEFESESGVEVVLSFGGSNALARQVELGAPADVVIFAGNGPMDQLEESGEIVASSRVDVLRNRLVVIGDGGSAPLTGIRDLLTTEGRIALADPVLAPVGLYAKQALEMSGLWKILRSRVIPTLDVRAAVGAVDTGSAAFGLVYATDVANAAGVVMVFEVPEELHDPIIYPAAIVKHRNGTDASEFLEFLVSDGAKAVFMRHGFVSASE
jgi:molybdate transport system substrate-binding protein